MGLSACWTLTGTAGTRGGRCKCASCRFGACCLDQGAGYVRRRGDGPRSATAWPRLMRWQGGGRRARGFGRGPCRLGRRRGRRRRSARPAGSGRRRDLADSDERAHHRRRAVASRRRRSESLRSAHQENGGLPDVRGPRHPSTRWESPLGATFELAKNSPENRPESLTSFRATNSNPDRETGSACKCTRSAESGSAPERIRTSDLRFRSRR